MDLSSLQTFGLVAALAVNFVALARVLFKLGQIHAEFRYTVKTVEDHEARLRSLESAPCSSV